MSEQIQSQKGPVQAVPNERAAGLPAIPVVSEETAQDAKMATVTLPPPGRIAQFVLVGLALWFIGWLLWRSRTSMIPFAAGLVLAYMLMPLVDRLARGGMSRPLAIGLIYVNGLILSALGFLFVVPPVIDQAQRLVDNIPSIDSLQDTSNWFLQEYRRRIPDTVQEPIDNAARNAIGAIQSNLASYAQRAGAFLVDQTLRLVGTLTFLIGFLIIPIWLFYILNDKEQGRSFVDGVIYRPARPDFWNVLGMVNTTFSDYIRGQLLLCAAVGALSGLGLLLLRLFGFDIPSILLLAIIAGITELIPIIGPIIGAIPAVLVALVSAENPGGAVLAVIVLYVIIQQVENNFLVPRIVGESVGIHPAILTIVLVAMGDVFGLIGVVLSAPLAAVARDLFTYAYRRFGGATPALALEVVTSRKRDVDMNAIDSPDKEKP